MGLKTRKLYLSIHIIEEREKLGKGVKDISFQLLAVSLRATNSLSISPCKGERITH
jgi:hypothetical protein